MKKHSKQRDAVYNALCSRRNHPTAIQVYDYVRQEIPNISLATVYRNLKDLVKDKKAIMLISGDSVDHYDATTEQHCHLCCSKCNCVYDIDCDIDLDLSGLKTEHKIEAVNIMYTGICNQCL